MDASALTWSRTSLEKSRNREILFQTLLNVGVSLSRFLCDHVQEKVQFFVNRHIPFRETASGAHSTRCTPGSCSSEHRGVSLEHRSKLSLRHYLMRKDSFPFAWLAERLGLKIVDWFQNILSALSAVRKWKDMFILLNSTEFRMVGQIWPGRRTFLLQWIFWERSLNWR